MKARERAMNELDFSGKQVLVVGGSSGIGNGIAQAFRAKGRAGRMSAAPAQAPPIIRRRKDRTSAASIISSSTSATPQAIEHFRAPLSSGSMCWCWRKAR